MLDKKKGEIVRETILKRLWRGDYLTASRKGLLSEAGARDYFKRLEEDGIILLKRIGSGKKRAIFTQKGVLFLKDREILDEENNLTGRFFV